MNPISKKIYNKLSEEDKTELKSEKIELRNISEINKNISFLKNAESNADKVLSKFEQSVSKAGDSWDEMIKFRNGIYGDYRNAMADIEDFKTAAKELGLDINSVNEIRELERLINVSKEVVKLLDKYPRPKI